MATSTIKIDVELMTTGCRQGIQWQATDGTDKINQAKAMMISFWDGQDKAALRIDLWTKNMMIDEMADFFYQTMMTMADTYGRATSHQDMVAEMKNFAGAFYRKFRDKQLQENKA